MLGAMSPSPRRFDEVSAGGVVVRPGATGWEVCLIGVRGTWSLPKGVVEAGESPEQAALREISEELGIPIDRLRLRAPLPASEYAYRHEGRLVSKRVHHFLVEVPAGTEAVPQAGEVDEVAWVPLAEAPRRVTYRDLHAALSEAARLLDAAADTPAS
jgi:8-oxo-dGTP pyrophosphatase MutT (NUDIX family)